MTEGQDVVILEKIKNSRDKDEEIVRIVKEMKKAKVKMLRGDEWQIDRKLVLKEGKGYVLKDEKLRAKIIWLHYNVPVARYGGRWKMTEMVTRNYWWPEITEDVGRYIEGYDMY